MGEVGSLRRAARIAARQVRQRRPHPIIAVIHFYAHYRLSRMRGLGRWRAAKIAWLWRSLRKYPPDQVERAMLKAWTDP